MKGFWKGLKTFGIFGATQALSQLGSAMTAFALTLWLYRKTGSALRTALLSICSYAPYVLMSLFAGTLADRLSKKRTLLVCDALAACCSVAVLALLRAGMLRPGHLYALNAFAGLMNTVQQPAADVALTLITPKAQYQRASALRSVSSSLVTILHPMLASALFAFAGMEGVIAVDLATFAVAFGALLFFVQIPEIERAPDAPRESVLFGARAGLAYLKAHPLVLTLIAFMAGVNLVASAFDAALPPYVLSSPRGGETALGVVSSCAGLATLAGSLLMTVLPPPRDRVRVILATMLLSLCTENFLLAFCRSPVWWCVAQVAGWALVPVMNANLDVVMRVSVPPEMQGRVYACRNTFQFLTIPIGTFLGGFLIDALDSPMAALSQRSLLVARLFGRGSGCGAAFVMFLLGVASVAVCMVFRKPLARHPFREPTDDKRM